MTAEEKFRREIGYCGACGACRDLLDHSCMVLPEIFRLWDRQEETDRTISTQDLRGLVELCSFCALCPCSSVRNALIDAKSEFMDRFGLTFAARALEDVERIATIGGRFPKICNAILARPAARRLLERTVGIHQDRKIPPIPAKNFPDLLKKRKPAEFHPHSAKKVAYFAGCTARYFFPEVASATTEVLEKNGIKVVHPEQSCCGLPAMLEGDREMTKRLARANMESLADMVDQGMDIVCSCPSCGYMLKYALKEGAYFSPEFIDTVTDELGFAKIPTRSDPNHDGTIKLPKNYFKVMFKGVDYLADLDPLTRIKIAENTYDVSEYLKKLTTDNPAPTMRPNAVRAAYYPPCHLREQNLENPYHFLLEKVPGLELASITGLYCCGNAGIMGFKRDFFQQSLKIAGRLLGKIKAADPDMIITECLSCRIQFNQLTDYAVRHPLEVINSAYGN
jgi:glycerol-3-phosphate dehydrogenase subunit C